MDLSDEHVTAAASIQEARLVLPETRNTAVPSREFTRDESGTPRPFIPVTDVGPSQTFADVVTARTSIRRLTPPTVDEIGLVIARSGLSRSTSTDASGFEVGSRAAPSAGGRHPFKLAVATDDVNGLPPGLWVLDPYRAVLNLDTTPLTRVESALRDVAKAARAPTPPAAVFVVADPDLTLSRYPHGISLLWREAGALLMLLHLAATDAGLGSCIIGTTGLLIDQPIYNSGPVDLGCIILGHIAA